MKCADAARNVRRDGGALVLQLAPFLSAALRQTAEDQPRRQTEALPPRGNPHRGAIVQSEEHRGAASPSRLFSQRPFSRFFLLKMQMRQRGSVTGNWVSGGITAL